MVIELNITVVNVSSSELVLEGTEITMGCTWAVAPTNVPTNGQEYKFRALNGNPFGDLKGVIHYRVTGGHIDLNFDCGSNSYQVGCSAEGYRGSSESEGGVTSSVTYRVFNK